MTDSPVLSFASSLSDGSKKIALVTGANKGIGKEIVRLLGKDENMTTIIACRSVSAGKAMMKELIEKDGCANLHIVPSSVDLADHASIEVVREYVESTFDSGRIDILINNAAVCFNDPTLYGKVEYAPFEKQARITIETNFWGTWKLTQNLTPCLDRSSSPRLINIASSAGRLGILKSKDLLQQFTSDDLTTTQIEELMDKFVHDVEAGTHRQFGWPDTCYGMSKVGIIALTRALARKHKAWMCNTVDPGYCATDQNNNQGNRPASRGAVTPFLLATLGTKEKDDNQFYSGMHWFDEQPMEWSYNQF